MTDQTAIDLADIRSTVNSEDMAPNTFDEQMGLG